MCHKYYFLTNIYKNNIIITGDIKMKKQLFFCLLVILFVQNNNGQTIGDLYIEENTGFSINIPQDWLISNIGPGFVVSEQGRGFRSNINILNQEYSRPVSDRIDELILEFSQDDANLDLVNRAYFTTISGIEGECITFQYLMRQIGRVRVKLYIFPNKSATEIMLIACTVLIINGEKYDSLFDDCLKTFNWER